MSAKREHLGWMVWFSPPTVVEPEGPLGVPEGLWSGVYFPVTPRLNVSGPVRTFPFVVPVGLPDGPRCMSVLGAMRVVL
jgi:hypothetical protein